jgi:hypothetical protein
MLLQTDNKPLLTFTAIPLQYQAFQHSSKYLEHPSSESGGIISHLPQGSVPVLTSLLGADRRRHFSVKLELQIDREHVLESLLDVLPAIISDDPTSLLLPVM